jgi:hypothetical protein
VLIAPVSGSPEVSWSESPPAGNDPLYTSVATWSITGTTGTDSSTTWTGATQQDEGTPVIAAEAIGRWVKDTGLDPATAQASYRSNLDGDAYEYEKEGAGSFVSIGTWLNTGSAGDYEVKLRDDGTGTDAVTGSSVDTWLDAGSTHTWTMSDTATSGVPKYFEGTIIYRNATSAEVLSEAAVKIQAFMTA